MIDGAMDAGAGEMDMRLLGQTLGGSYRVLRRIGAGGMGQVYEAEHTLLGRHFALKVLDTQQRTRRDAVSRFFAEARAASQIQHPHIVDVVNFLTDGPFMVLVMELLRGESLAERLLRGPLSIAETVAITSQVCDAVAATHAAGILHRDLKPANVFLCQSASGPFAKVLDYGIAKLRRPDGGGGSDDDSAAQQAVGVTTTGQLLGTPRYLSPEQARGALELDERADVYSAGVMLFEMIAGRPPFDGQNAFQLLWKHGNEAPPRLSERAAGISPALDEVLARALAKEPAERYPSMLALRDALVAATARASEPLHEGRAAPPTAGGDPSPPRPDERGGSTKAESDSPSAGNHASRANLRVHRGALGVVGLALALALMLTLGLRSVPTTRVDSEPHANGVLGGAPEPVPAPATRTASAHVELEQSADPHPTTAPLADAESAPRAAEVSLRFTVEPADARVAVDDGDSMPVPDTLRVSAGRGVRLLFTAPGFLPEPRALRASEDTDVVVALRRRRGRGGREAATSPIKRDF